MTNTTEPKETIDQSKQLLQIGRLSAVRGLGMGAGMIITVLNR